MILKNKFNGKLKPMKEKIDNLELVYQDRKTKHESHASLQALDQQIEQLTKTRDHYTMKNDEYEKLGREFQEKCQNSQQQIDRVKAELTAFNRQNLKKIYELEDVMD